MQKTAYEMRISDWSSDVCSSDLIPMTRSGKQPLQELHTLWALFRLFRALRPALVHLVTIKPVLYGGIAARLARVPAMVSALSRSEERRVGKECVSTCRSRWSPYH